MAIRGLDLTLGISHAFGNREIERPVDLTRPGASDPLLGDVTSTGVEYRRWKFIIGLSLVF